MLLCQFHHFSIHTFQHHPEGNKPFCNGNNDFQDSRYTWYTLHKTVRKHILHLFTGRKFGKWSTQTHIFWVGFFSWFPSRVGFIQVSPSPKTNIHRTCQEAGPQKRGFHLPTMNFQVRLLLVSRRVPIKYHDSQSPPRNRKQWRYFLATETFLTHRDVGWSKWPNAKIVLRSN